MEIILGSRGDFRGCDENENNNNTGDESNGRYGDRKKNAAEARPARTVTRGRGRGRIVEDILQKLEATFTGDQAAVKATLGDYIRLVQLRKELDDEEPREIRVTWVEGEAAEKKSETKFDSEE